MSFFGGMPFPVQFFLAFVIVLGLIGATAWAVRRFGAGRLGAGIVRGRQPRLAVIDHASVDGRRRLILVRRDNVEHLVMIGGPTDIVVEANIVRAVAAPRDAAAGRPAAGVEALPRTIALPDGTNPGSWPLQPEPAAAQRAVRSEPAADEPAWPLQPQSETPPRPQRDTLAALADELSTRPSAPPRSRPQPSVRPAEPREELRQEAHQDSVPEPHVESPNVPPSIVEPAAAADENIAEMAQQLEAALRKPTAHADRSEAREPRAAAMPRPFLRSDRAASAEASHLAAAAQPAAPVPPLRAGRQSAELKPPRPDTKQPNSGKSLYDSLEQEMATLLGRPGSKH